MEHWSTGHCYALFTWEAGHGPPYESFCEDEAVAKTCKVFAARLHQGVRALLEAIPYRTNEVYLHTDADLMPRRRSTWASWNFLGASGAGADSADVCVTYWLNNLQVLSESLFTSSAPTACDAFLLCKTC